MTATPAQEVPVQPIDEALATIFGTPLVITDWADSDAMNASLATLIATARAAAPSAGKSNVGGWHSPGDFILGDALALVRLRERIRSITIELTKRVMVPGAYGFGMEGWANVLGPGDYNGPHNHPNATWSGVYYLTGVPGDGQGPLAGKIEFFDPRPAAGMVYAADNMLQRRCLFAPRPGCLLVFPSWLQHMVHPHAGGGERVSIAFNVTMTK